VIGQTLTPRPGEDVYMATLARYEREIERTGRFLPSAGMILAAWKKARGEL
jgi:hypothetical protein